MRTKNYNKTTSQTVLISNMYFFSCSLQFDVNSYKKVHVRATICNDSLLYYMPCFLRTNLNFSSFGLRKILSLVSK